MKRYERNYEDGQLNGLWMEWHEDGRKKATKHYKVGKETQKVMRFIKSLLNYRFSRINYLEFRTLNTLMPQKSVT